MSRGQSNTIFVGGNCWKSFRTSSDRMTTEKYHLDLGDIQYPELVGERSSELGGESGCGS
jgi:hypothetical protein